MFNNIKHLFFRLSQTRVNDREVILDKIFQLFFKSLEFATIAIGSLGSLVNKKRG